MRAALKWCKEMKTKKCRKWYIHAKVSCNKSGLFVRGNLWYAGV